MSNIFEKMWDGLKQIIYEFQHPKEVREKTRKYIDSKGKKMIDEVNEDPSSYICAGARVVCSGSHSTAADGDVIVFNPTHASVFFDGKRIMGTTADIKGENFIFLGKIVCDLREDKSCALNRGIGSLRWENYSKLQIGEENALLENTYAECPEGGLVRFFTSGQDSEFISFVSSYIDPNQGRIVKTVYTAVTLYKSGVDVGMAVAEKSVIKFVPAGVEFLGGTRSLITTTTGVDFCYEAGYAYMKKRSEKDKKKMGQKGAKTCDFVENATSVFSLGTDSADFIVNKNKEIKARNLEIIESKTRIEELERKLTSGNLTDLDKKYIRNRISANKYGIEVNELNITVAENDIRKRLENEYRKAPKTLGKYTKDQIKGKLLESITQPWVDYETNYITRTEGHFYTTEPTNVE
ncbi:PAAR-like protein [Leptotrichia wadei]|uniref:PAAR-like protein n=1 Tax=Leptotrichia wadei TaxID=157687 RepID=UPI0028E35365|nr:PAAR-like protein [uncultured Leptotrichia sp.]